MSDLSLHGALPPTTPGYHANAAALHVNPYESQSDDHRAFNKLPSYKLVEYVLEAMMHMQRLSPADARHTIGGGNKSRVVIRHDAQGFEVVCKVFWMYMTSERREVFPELAALQALQGPGVVQLLDSAELNSATLLSPAVRVHLEPRDIQRAQNYVGIKLCVAVMPLCGVTVRCRGLGRLTNASSRRSSIRASTATACYSLKLGSSTCSACSIAGPTRASLWAIDTRATSSSTALAMSR